MDLHPEGLVLIRMAYCAFMCVGLVAGAAPALGAQHPFARPRLAAAADTNSWEAYFDLGVALLRRRPDEAEAAFYWASRLNPERAEPLFGRWVAFHLLDQKRWTDYLDEREKVRSAPDVLAHDSLRLAAMARNPFVHRGLEIILYDELPGRWRQDDLSLGWIAYAKPDFPDALRHFARAVRHDPRRYARVRALRAQAFVAQRQFDSAQAEMLALAAELERRDAERTVAAYESKEFLHYASGLLYAIRGQPEQAREALRSAVVENLAFYPAQLWLGDLALNGGDPAAAAHDYEEALVVGSKDAVLQYHYGLALAGLGRHQEAAAALRRAVELEAWYAAPWLELGRALERTGDAGAARGAYETYVGRAPRAAQGVDVARSRLATLSERAGTSSGHP